MQTHYWRVRAKDGDGQYGTWSAIQSLAVNIGAVSGLSPSDGSTTTDTTPALSWNAVPGAAGYEVQIADSEAGLASAQAVEAGGTSYTPTTALTNNTTHHWRVRAAKGGWPVHNRKDAYGMGMGSMGSGVQSTVWR